MGLAAELKNKQFIINSESRWRVDRTPILKDWPSKALKQDLMGLGETEAFTQQWDLQATRVDKHILNRYICAR